MLIDKYHRHVSNIKTGDLLLCRGNWLMSKTIRLLTGGEYSHAAIAVWIRFNGVKRLCMFEAMEGSDVRIVPLYDTLKEYYWPYNDAYVTHKPLLSTTPDDRVNSFSGDYLIDYMLEHWSYKYANWYQFVVGVSPTIRKIRRFFGRNEDTGKDNYHCSEIIATALREQGYELLKNASMVTPSDLDSFTCFGAGTNLDFSGFKQIQINCKEGY
jgi:hypothetical protein